MTLNNADNTESAKKIKLVIFDIDGVMTDGGLIFGDDGQQYKRFDVKDGQGLRLLQKAGIQIGIISARKSKVVEQRMHELDIEHIYQGQQQKRQAYEALKTKLALGDDEVAFVGDDLPDLSIMLRAGLALTVSNAHTLIKQHADWVAPSKGGHGAVREICEFILRAQNKYEEIIEEYFYA